MKVIWERYYDLWFFMFILDLYLIISVWLLESYIFVKDKVKNLDFLGYL